MLRPLLSLVLISDISEEITSACLSSFGDDAREAKGINSVEDMEAVQSDLQSIFNWLKERKEKKNKTMEFSCPNHE